MPGKRFPERFFRLYVWRAQTFFVRLARARDVAAQPSSQAQIEPREFQGTWRRGQRDAAVVLRFVDLPGKKQRLRQEERFRWKAPGHRQPKIAGPIGLIGPARQKITCQQAGAGAIKSGVGVCLDDPAVPFQRILDPPQIFQAQPQVDHYHRVVIVPDDPVVQRQLFLGASLGLPDAGL